MDHPTAVDAAELLQRLKRSLGCGGTLAASTSARGEPCLRLELQGDLRDRAVRELVALGFPSRRAGS